jgi:hypothetical protein
VTCLRDSAIPMERPLTIEYAADLTPDVAAKESGASWNARWMAETRMAETA